MKKIFFLLLTFIFTINFTAAFECHSLGSAYRQINKYAKQNNVKQLDTFLDENTYGKDAVVYYSDKLIYKCLKKKYSPQVFEVLLKHGANINFLVEPPIMTAIIYNEEELVRVMIDNGLDVNKTYKAQRTALICAADYNANPRVIKMLIDAGADVNAMDTWGNTPLSTLCRREPYSQGIYYLIDAGADLYGYSTRHKMPLSLLPKSRQAKIRNYYDNHMTSVLRQKYIDSTKNKIIATFGSPQSKYNIDKNTEIWEYRNDIEHYFSMSSETTQFTRYTARTIYKGGYTEKAIKKISFTISRNAVRDVKFESFYNTGR